MASEHQHHWHDVSISASAHDPTNVHRRRVIAAHRECPGWFVSVEVRLQERVEAVVVDALTVERNPFGSGGTAWSARDDAPWPAPLMKVLSWFGSAKGREWLTRQVAEVEGRWALQGIKPAGRGRPPAASSVELVDLLHEVQVAGDLEQVLEHWHLSEGQFRRRCELAKERGLAKASPIRGEPLLLTDLGEAIRTGDSPVIEAPVGALDRLRAAREHPADPPSDPEEL